MVNQNEEDVTLAAALAASTTGSTPAPVAATGSAPALAADPAPAWLPSPFLPTKLPSSYVLEKFYGLYQQEPATSPNDLTDWLCVDFVKCLMSADWSAERRLTPGGSVHALNKRIEYQVHTIVQRLSKMTEEKASYYLDRIHAQSSILYALVRYSQDRANGAALRQLRELDRLSTSLALKANDPLPTEESIRAEAERRRLEAEEEARRREALKRVDVEEARRAQARRVQVDTEAAANTASDVPQNGQ